MINSLLSSSSVHIFGQKVSDIAFVGYVSKEKIKDVRLAEKTNLTLTAALNDVDGVITVVGDIVLLMGQTTALENGVYTLDGTRKPSGVKEYDATHHYRVQEGAEFGGKTLQGADATPSSFTETNPNIAATEVGNNRFLLGQLGERKPGFAQIYGFSFEGQYYGLERPTVFLVHGDGSAVSDKEFAGVPARAPRDPGQTGIGAADFHIASRLRVWEYDKADFTVRMDLHGGRFEDVLLDFELDYGDDPMFGGGKVGGGKVGGGKVGGGKVGGGKVGGGKVGGGKVGGGKVGGG